MKLTIKHLAPYLPYGLNMIDKDWITRELVALQTNGYYYTLKKEGKLMDVTYTNRVLYDQIDKPILRPLSDVKALVKDANLDITDEILLEEFAERWLRVGQLDYDCFQFLVKNHFDVFGLIEADLAVGKIGTTAKDNADGDGMFKDRLVEKLKEGAE